jgi:hypothetical protein
MVGLFQTDGTHSGDPSGKGRLSIEIAERDADLLPRLQRHIPVHSFIGTRTRKTNFASVSVTAYLHVYHRTARAEFERFGVLTGRKSEVIRPPSEEFSRPDYLRGLIDGDGAVGFTARGYPFVSLATASPFVAQHFCSEIEAVCSVKRTARRNGRDGMFNVLVANAPAVELARWCYPHGSLALSRKHAAASEIIEWTAPTARFGHTRKAWTAEEDAVVLSGRSVKEAAALLLRTEQSVNLRRWRLRHREDTHAVQHP